MAQITIQADRRDVIRIVLDPATIETKADGSPLAEVVGFAGEVAETGQYVTGDMALGVLIQGELRQAMLDGRVKSIRLFSGTGQQMTVLPNELCEGDICVLRRGRPVSIDETSILELMMPDQHRFLARSAGKVPA